MFPSENASEDFTGLDAFVLTGPQFCNLKVDKHKRIHRRILLFGAQWQF